MVPMCQPLSFKENKIFKLILSLYKLEAKLILMYKLLALISKQKSIDECLNWLGFKKL